MGIAMKVIEGIADEVAEVVLEAEVEEIEHVTIVTKKVTWLENVRKKIVEDDRHKFIPSMKGLQLSYHLVGVVRVPSINSYSYYNAFAVLLLTIHVVLHTLMRYLFV